MTRVLKWLGFAVGLLATMLTLPSWPAYVGQAGSADSPASQPSAAGFDPPPWQSPQAWFSPLPRMSGAAAQRPAGGASRPSFEVELTPGEYLLVGFSTAPDGRAHMEHGMVQQVLVG